MRLMPPAIHPCGENYERFKMVAPQYVIYSADWCSYCKTAKSILTGLGIPFEERDVADPEHLSFVKEQGFKTIPQIYRVDGDAPEYIGGCDDLKAYLKVGI